MLDLLFTETSPRYSSIALGLFTSWLLYWLTIYIYRAYFSPLSHTPGPRLAAATFWYEFYYEIYPNKFQYLWKIRELHEQYGPIVRINPRHIHIHDATFWDTIYAPGSKKRNRCTWWHHTGARLMQGSLVETIDHDVHKMRRHAIDPFFSKRSIRAMESAVLAKVRILTSRFRAEMSGGASSASRASRARPLDSEEPIRSSSSVVNLRDAMAGLTMDVISEYCFGEGMNSLSNTHYGRDWYMLFHDGVQGRTLGRQFPTLINFMFDLPSSLMERISERFARIGRIRDTLQARVRAIAEGRDKAESGKRTIMHELLEKDIPAEEKQTHRVAAQALNFLGAGTISTARTLCVALYYVYSNGAIRQALRDELRDVMPDKTSDPPLHVLEGLPYLAAVVNEALRTAHGVSSRQPRIATEETLMYKQYTIPPGTALMQSGYLHHMNPALFPEPLEFRPERWIEDPKLVRWNFAFGRGAMSCVGMNLAVSELYLTIAHVVRWFDMEIWDTVEERDVLVSNDVFVGMPHLKSEGVKAKLIRELSE